MSQLSLAISRDSVMCPLYSIEQSVRVRQLPGHTSSYVAHRRSNAMVVVAQHHRHGMSHRVTKIPARSKTSNPFLRWQNCLNYRLCLSHIAN